MRYAPGLACAALPLLVVACKQERPPEKPVRPVLSTVVAPRAEQVLGFTGSVEPRYRVSLGFRILGRLIARDVEVGDQVKTGVRLAAIDPIALNLALRSAQADVFTAQAQFTNATGVEDRQRTLLEQNTATQAQFESAQQARAAADAALKRAQANLTKAREQQGYAELRSDIDGVVTAIGAEVGQVVAAGQSVVTVARPSIRDASFDVPEDIARDLKPDTAFDVALQLDPTIRTTGRVREVAPLADQATRTRRVLATLGDPPEIFRLGTTITATLTRPVVPAIVLPRSALLDEGGRDLVWIVDPATKTVAQRAVTLAERGPQAIRIATGLAPGDRVVTAGVHSLTPGQTVKIMDEPAR